MNSGHNFNIFTGLLLSICGLFGILTGHTGRLWDGVIVPGWVGWILLPLGIIIIVLSIIGKKRNIKPQYKTYTQDDIAQAKAWFDATVSNNADEETRKNIAKIDEVMDLSKSTDNGVAMKLEQQPGADVQQTGRQV